MNKGERSLAKNGRPPDYYLSIYKSTTRPRPCIRCNQNGYYEHPEWGRVCAACLLDLINIGEMLWKWEDYPEVWRRMDQLIARAFGGTEKQIEPVLVIDQRKKAGKKSDG
jgi:hypothetical protein